MVGSDPEHKKAMTRKFGELLLKRQCVNADQLKQALAEQTDSGGRLGSILLQQGHLSAEEVGQCLSIQHGVPFASANQLAYSTQEALQSVPGKLCHKYGVIPLDLAGGVLSLAMVDPKRSIAGELSFLLALKIKRYVSVSEDIQQFLKLYYARQGERIQLRDIGDIEASGGTQDPPQATATAQPKRQVRHTPVAITNNGVMIAASARSGNLSDNQGLEDDGQGRRVEQILRALNRAASVDQVCDLLVEPMEQEVALAVLLEVDREQKLARGYRALGPGGKLEHPDQLLLSLAAPSLLQETYRSTAVHRASGDEVDLMQQRLAGFLRQPNPGEVHVAPVLVGIEVRYLLCLHAGPGSHLPRRSRDDLQVVADAASQALERLMFGEQQDIETIQRLKRDLERLRAERDRAVSAREVMMSQMVNTQPRSREPSSRVRGLLALTFCFMLLLAMVYLASELYIPTLRSASSGVSTVEQRTLNVGTPDHVPPLIRRVPPRPAPAPAPAQ